MVNKLPNLKTKNIIEETLGNKMSQKIAKIYQKRL
jgi:hypothetical protein